MHDLNKSKLCDLLSGKLPGKKAQIKMAPDAIINFPTNTNCKEAAVLLLIYPENNQLRIVFMKRNEYDGPHSGQISFPGGMKEPSDIEFAYTALRETEEETGVVVSQIEILGALTPLFIPVSNFCVHPFVGWTDIKPVFAPDKSEVQYLICPTLNEFTNEENIKHGFINHQLTKISTHYFNIDGEIIWGATAMILSEFMALIDY